MFQYLSAALPRRVAAPIAAIGFLAFSAAPSGAVEIERVTSPKGIEAWLVHDETIPVIAMNFSFAGGSAQDPEGKEGVTRLLAATLDEGAGSMTSEEYQGKLEDLAVSVGFNTDKDNFYGSLRTLTTTRNEAFDMLRLAVNEPRFDETAINRMKTQIASGIRRASQDPDSVASRELMKAMLGDHPYARPNDGTEESLAALTADDLKKMKTRLMTREGLKIGVVGAIDAQTLAPLLDEVFAGLPEKGDLVAVPEVTAETGKTVNTTMDVQQTSILFALPGLKRDDPDYQAAYVMNHILGGGTFTSWMYEEVREKRGLTYGAYTQLAPYDHTGLLFGSAATRADRTGETMKVMRDQLTRMATEGPTQEELDSAKRFITGSYPLRFDSSGKIALQLVAIQNAKLGIDYFDRRNAEVEAVTLADVKRVAKRLLDGKEPSISTVGPEIKAN